jgi:hypothetical protein
MIRYYLIPFETDKPKLESFGYKKGVAPKYLDLIGVAGGMQPLPEQYKDGEVSVWRENYYVVAMERDNASDYTEIESKSDVIRIDSTTDKSTLSGLGMDTAKIKGDGYIERDKAVTKWLTGEEKILGDSLRG